MFRPINIQNELVRQRRRSLKKSDAVLDEVHKILKADLFKEHNILNNLKSYNKSFELLNEEGLDTNFVFKKEDIKAVAVNYRLRFLDSQVFEGDIPYEAILKIKHLNSEQGKDLRGFKILAQPYAFKDKTAKSELTLFAPTVYGNYYLVHKWGEDMKWYKKLTTFPMRRFETLFPSLLLLTLVTVLLVPTRQLTLDREATYWCGYRIAAFFHLLIFYSGFTVYMLFGFNKPFSNSIWESDRSLK
ncbi:MAG: hypothetical protein ACXVP0_09545 [Bacteroidia bacterium]